ncbi:methyltransferase domain-containing protein [Limisphaera sp. VF-2]|uniref:methyltransferase domain-containing protein n=1 Tax=Limisphaera sp. VF-2 TaxID=3400418 RepID=UPI003C1A8A93
MAIAEQQTLENSRQARQADAGRSEGLGGFVRGLIDFFGACSVAELEWLNADTIRWQWHSPESRRSLAPLEIRLSAGVGVLTPLPEAPAETVFCVGTVGRLPEDALDAWLPELRRLVGRNLWITLEASGERSRVWWERRFLAAGFRKHPLTPVLVPFDESADHAPVQVLVFEKIPDAAMAEHPLSALEAERNLHMDMLREPGVRSDAHLARYALARQHVRPGAVVLDAACGLGYGSAVLAAGTGAGRIVGLDCSAWAIEYARLHYASGDPRLEFHRGDVTRLDFLEDASVDLVVSFETLEHLPNPELALREFARVLKPGGFFIGSVPNLWVDEQGRNPVPYHLHVYEFAQFHDQVARWFDWRALYRQNAGGGWKRPQPRRLVPIPELSPTPEDQRDAEWWICVAEKRKNAARCSDSPSSSPQPSPEVAAPTLLKTSTTVVLATNYLLWTPATRWMWETLGEELARQHCQLVLLSTTLPDPPLPFPVSLHPYLLRDFASMFPGWTGAEGLSASPGEMHWLRADTSRAAHGYGLDQALAGLAAFRTYYRGMLERLQPAFLLLADNTLAQTALAQRLAWDSHLPGLIYERGLLPDTLMVESRGIQAWSDLRMHWLAQEMPPAPAERFAAIQSYYRTRRPQKYPQPETPGGAKELRRQLGADDKRLVVFLGGGYEANGHGRYSPNYDRNFFTGLPSTQEALMALWQVVRQRPDTVFVFKPHPLDADPYAVAKIEGIPVVRDVNVHTLIEAADVIAAQYTTLQFEAVLYDKPVLLLARSAWWGRGATYEVDAPESLASRLDEALTRRGWPEIRARAQAFLCWIMDRFLIGAAPDVPTRRHLRDFAAYIARVAMDSRGLPPAACRWKETRNWLEAHRARPNGGCL